MQSWKAMNLEWLRQLHCIEASSATGPSLGWMLSKNESEAMSCLSVASVVRNVLSAKFKPYGASVPELKPRRVPLEEWQQFVLSHSGDITPVAYEDPAGIPLTTH
jgi:hypothetical protein